MAAKGGSLEEKIANVDVALESVREDLKQLIDENLLDAREEIIVTAGGSLYFDRVVEAMRQLLCLFSNIKVVLRGGCCVTHEAGENDCLSPLGGRGFAQHTLQQALELWGLVTSLPEPGLAILNFGKRDAPFDKGPPIAFALKRPDAQVEPLNSEPKILSLNDHHARLSIPPSLDLSLGDLVGFHIAHPCTAFDKWRLVPVVDDSYRVKDAILTFF